MTDFHDLLPPRLAVSPPLPSRGGAPAIRSAAKQRRKSSATKALGAGTVAALAFAGVVALRPVPGSTGIDVDPAATHPPATPGTAHVIVPNPPFGGGVRRAPSTGAASPTGTAPTSAAPAAGPPTGPVASASPTPRPPSLPPHTRSFVLDPDPGNDCLQETSYTQPGVVLCTRTIAPPTLAPGEGAVFVFQACAAGGIEQKVRFTGSREVKVDVRSGGNYSNGPVLWEKWYDYGNVEHDVVIPANHCLQHTFPWHGRTAQGKPLAAGTYSAVSMLAADWTPVFISNGVFEVR